MKQPLVSVVIACYNTEKYIEEAVQSILTQTYQNLEIIIIDDGSSDDSYTILLRLSKEDKRIRLFRNEQNIKTARTTNKAIKLCDGEFIAIMDADDICIPTRIEKQVKFLQENRNIGVLGTGLILMKLNKKLKSIKKSALNEDIKTHLFFESAIHHNTAMFNIAVVKKEWIKYDESFYIIQDYNLWVDLMINHTIPFANLAEDLLYYRELPTGMTMSSHKNYLEKERVLYLIHKKLFAFKDIQVTDDEICNFIKNYHDIYFTEKTDLRLLKSTFNKIKIKLGKKYDTYVHKRWFVLAIKKLLKFQIKDGLTMFLSRWFWVGGYERVIKNKNIKGGI